MNFELDEKKRKFFKNCKIVARTPASIFLEGDRFSKKAKLLPLSLYAYVGIEDKNLSEFEYEEHSDVVLRIWADYKDRELLLSDLLKSEYPTLFPNDPDEEETLSESEKSMVLTHTPISSLYRDRNFWYKNLLNEKFKPFLLRKDYFRIKVWSDIPSGVGLNENAAIAVGTSILLNLILSKKTEKENQILNELEKVTDRFREDSITNISFSQIFGLSLALDFFSNGAAVFTSLMGTSKEHEIVEYNCLFYNDFKEFFNPYPYLPLADIQLPKALMKFIEELKNFKVEEPLYRYFDKAFNLYSQVCKGNPLYKWTSIKSPELNEGKTHFLVVRRHKTEYRDDIMRPISNKDFKYYQICPNTFVILGEPNILAFCSANFGKYVFGKSDKCTALFSMVYSSKERGWGAKGLQVMDLTKEQHPEEYKLPKHPVTPSIRPLKEIEKKKLQYARMWNKDKPEGAYIDKQKFDNFVASKKDYKILIIDQGEYKSGSVGEVYFNNKLVSPHYLPDNKVLAKRIKSQKDTKKQKERYLTPLEYRLLVYTLKQKGIAGDIFMIIEKCWFKPHLAKSLKEEWQKAVRGEGSKDDFKTNTSGFRKAIAVLSTFLQSEIGIQLRSFKTGKFRLSKSMEYCVVEKIIY